jgi:alkylation response protein AidB-like acyl-CoA dehydrogenase
VRVWLEKHVPDDWRDRMRGADQAQYTEFQRSWLHRLRDGGLAAPHWSKDWGGGGLSVGQQVVLAQELARADAPELQLFFIGLYHTYATLMESGTDSQRELYLPRILDGEVWCQGFSEPEAGSDLAALRTSARRSGDAYVINGQKIWSGRGDVAQQCLLLARTDPDAPKRHGISLFILDMATPGVSAIPIAQANGEHHFSEIFLDNVTIRSDCLVGAENDGWRAAQGTLATERGITTLERIERLRHHRDTLLRLLVSRRAGLSPSEEGWMLQEYAAIHAEIEVLRLGVHELMVGLASGQATAVDAAISKVLYSEALQRMSDFASRLAGLEDQIQQEPVAGVTWESPHWLFSYISSWAWTLGGGTNEIMRNIIAERGLGLPREPQVGV